MKPLYFKRARYARLDTLLCDDRHSKQSSLKKGYKNPLVETAINARLLMLPFPGNNSLLCKSKKCSMPFTTFRVNIALTLSLNVVNGLIKTIYNSLSRSILSTPLPTNDKLT